MKINAQAQKWFSENPLGQKRKLGKQLKAESEKPVFDRHEAIRLNLRIQEFDVNAIDPHIKKAG